MTMYGTRKTKKPLKAVGTRKTKKPLKAVGTRKTNKPLKTVGTAAMKKGRPVAKTESNIIARRNKW